MLPLLERVMSEPSSTTCSRSSFFMSAFLSKSIFRASFSIDCPIFMDPFPIAKAASMGYNSQGD